MAKRKPNKEQMAYTDHELMVISHAQAIMDNRARYSRGRAPLTNTDEAKQYAALMLAEYVAQGIEAFGLIMLNQRHRLIDRMVISTGTVTEATVYPREVVRACIENNAAAVIFCHNHPSGDARPSDPDLRITQRLKDALALVDIRTIDHIIVGCESNYSFSENNTL